MTLKQIIKDNRDFLDSCIANALGCSVEELPHRNDEERRLWIMNDEGLYYWARRKGARI